MARRIELTPEEIAALIATIDEGVLPPAELLPRLFPQLAESFDVQKLDQSKLPTLEYAGKRSRSAILAEAAAGIGAAPLQTVRCLGEPKDEEWTNMIVQGDNLQFLKTCYKNTDPLIKDKVKGKIKLIYIDPPFATKSDFNGKEGEKSYTDKVATAEFIESLRERLIYMRELLADDGNIYLHCDWRMNAYIRLVMNEVFGTNNFINEITWKRANTVKGNIGQGSKYMGANTDTIFAYAKTQSYIFNNVFLPYSQEYISSFFKYTDSETRRKYRLVSMIGPGGAAKGNPSYEIMGITRYWRYSEATMKDLMAKGLIVQTSPGTVPQKKQYLDDGFGVSIQSLWDDITGIGGTGYPTQKPEALLERIIKASSNEGDLVADFFCGSGTTAAVAEKLGRRWIACDFGKHAIYTIQRRMLHIGESKAIDENGLVKTKKGNPYNRSPKPFQVISSGAYDFRHVMDLRKHKEMYIDFVLGLFQMIKLKPEEQAKWQLANVYGEKEGHPVEVYPVWDDQYLKEVRIDETYLKDILVQTGGKLRGQYFIVAPETCANIGDTTLKNRDGKNVEFILLSFPYKVLEDISRNLTLSDQPSSQDRVNELITSTAFYFNEEVKITAVRTDHSIRLTQFETKILDKDGKRREGFSGLAMVLVDVDYEPGKPFDMDKTVFANEIAADGSFPVDAEAGRKIGIIAVDKHGNESKPLLVN